MYYKAKSKVNWPVVITISVVVFFLLIIVTILIINYLKGKAPVEKPGEVVNNAIPEVNLSLNTEEPNQEKVLINVKITTTDEAGLEKIVIQGLQDILIEEDNKQVYETTFTATKNATYEIQAYGKNGVFGSNKIQIKNIKVFNATEPYIPEGFVQVEGTEVSKGLVVKDTKGNEYVWVPVPGGQLTRNRQETDSMYSEKDSEYFQFVNSVGKYQGFYIARYEASVVSVNEKEAASSKPNTFPIHRISFDKANQLSKEVAQTYGYEKCQTSIISSSAWDTTLAWVDKSYSDFLKSTAYGNYSGTLKATGTTEKDKVNNIFDLAGNLAEWTSEYYKLTNDGENNNSEEAQNYRVIRGGSATRSSDVRRTTAGNPQSTYEHIGFRYVLFKD